LTKLSKHSKILTMKHIVEQKKGSSIYVYEIESYWDSEKKQPRQRRLYLGKKKTADGPLIPKRVAATTVPRLCCDFGNVYLLREIAKRIGLVDVLRQALPDDAELLLLLAMYEVIEEDPMYLFPAWADDVTHELKTIPSSARLSELLQELGVNDRKRESFMQKWMKKHADSEAVIYDITSISSHSRFIDLCEWGYNRDGEKLPQINLGLVCTLPGQIPLAYRIHSGSLSDVSTLQGTIKYLKSLGISSPLYVMDRGFWSKKNISYMNKAYLRFVMPIPLANSCATDLMAQVSHTLRCPNNVLRVQNRIYYHQKMPLVMDTVSLNSHIYYDHQRQVDEENTFWRRILDIEDAVAELGTSSISKVQQFLNNSAPDIRSCFEIISTDEIVQLQRKPKALSRRLNRMGFLLLATTENFTKPAACLHHYRQRDMIEKIIDSMKHEMDGKRLRVHGKEAMEGRLFMMFLAMILRCAVEQACRDAQLFKTYSVAEIFAELKKVKKIELSDGKSMITELTKKQCDLYTAMKVDLPEQA